jgi:hypothetical protein
MELLANQTHPCKGDLILNITGSHGPSLALDDPIMPGFK